MKKIYLFLIFLILSDLSLSKNVLPSPQQEIQAAMNNSLECWNAANLKCFMNLYLKSDETVYVSGTSFIYGWQNIYQNYVSRYGGSRQSMGQLKIDLLGKIKMLDNRHALVFGRFHLKIANKVYNGVTELIFINYNGSWKVMVDHSNT